MAENINIGTRQPAEITLMPVGKQAVSLEVAGGGGGSIPYPGPYEYDPSEDPQTIPIQGKTASEDILLNPVSSTYVGSGIPVDQIPSVDGPTVTIPTGYYSHDAQARVSYADVSKGDKITVKPNVNFDPKSGEFSVDIQEDTEINPIEKDGYAEKSASVPIMILGSASEQLKTVAGTTVRPSENQQTAAGGGTFLTGDIIVDAIPSNYVGSAVPTLGATSYTPTKVQQTIAANQYLTGVQTIEPIPDQYYDMSGDMSWLGKGAELIGQSFYSKVDTLNNTDYNGWTPSTTAKACVASVTLSDAKFTATDVDQYAYYIFWECGCDIAYTGSPTLKALPTFSRALIVQNLVKRPDTMARIQAVDCNATVNQAAYTASFLRYYGTTTGSITYTWASSNGLYFTATAPTISSTTATAPTITPKTPVFNAKVSTTYMSTASANAIDQANTKWWIKGTKIYRVKRECFFDGIYRYFCGVINSTAPTA